MNKKSIITLLITLATMAGYGQSTKYATIEGYSPALKDGTMVIGGAGDSWEIVDNVKGGHFTLTIPVEELSVGGFALMDEDCTHFSIRLVLKPDVTVKVTGTNLLTPFWKVESAIPEQQTLNRITEYCRNTILELIQNEKSSDRAKMDSLNMVFLKQKMDILPSLPVDLASVDIVAGIARPLKNMKDFPYMEQLKDLEKTFAARAPKGLEAELAEIHNLVYPSQVLQLGDEAVDAELFDMQGNKHRLFDAFADGRYVLLEFWGIGCGGCRLSEPELHEVYQREQARQDVKLEIVGISMDNSSTWKNSNYSKSIVWKNWSDGMKGSSLSSKYCDVGAAPYFVLMSPDKRIVWKGLGYMPGWFFGMADVINGPKQDNGSNMNVAVRKVDTNSASTKVVFRVYAPKSSTFRIAKGSYLEANGKKYKLTAADGIQLDAENHLEVNVFTEKSFIGDINYSEFTLTFEPFENIPETFDFTEGDFEGAYVIRNIKL